MLFIWNLAVFSGHSLWEQGHFLSHPLPPDLRVGYMSSVFFHDWQNDDLGTRGPQQSPSTQSALYTYLLADWLMDFNAMLNIPNYLTYKFL